MVIKQIIIEAPGAGSRLLNQALFKRLKARTLAILAIAFSLSIGIYCAALPYLGLAHEAIIVAGALLLIIFSLVLRGLRNHPYQRFGAANVVTTIRAVIVCLVAAAMLFARDLSVASSALWPIIGLITLALLLDGIDGYLARTLNLASELGARFDMEVDAFLLLVLSIGVFLLDKAGPWVLAIGMMRYCFVIAQFFVPALKGKLLPSFRRKLICVIQGAILCLCLVPFIPPVWSGSLAFVALVLLSYSFSVDTIFLLLRAKGEPGQ
nr:CDP-alcohol phosphatidyltransferase family protein [uncultured Cohaesibacter sp.]